MFKKPRMKYTDMCIWVDENAYRDDCDESKLFEYIYHIAKMLAFQGRYFNTGRKYEDFSIEVATRMFVKMRRGNNSKVKSILNYLKSALHFYKIDFERSEYSQQPDIESDVYRDSVVFDLMDNRINELAMVEFRSYMGCINNTFRKYIFNLPYASDKALIENIYISCVLSFISSVTPDKRLRGTFEDKLRKTQTSDNTILYHLDKSFKPLIQITVNKLKRIVCAELSDELHSDVRPETILSEIGFGGDLIEN